MALGVWCWANPMSMNQMSMNPMMGSSMGNAMSSAMSNGGMSNDMSMDKMGNAPAMNMLYNCVDCSYKAPDGTYTQNILNDSMSPMITYEQPMKVKILVQDNNCPNCGLFEVSVRANSKKLANTKWWENIWCYNASK